MPGDWIKVEIDTPHKPEVLKLARILGIHKAQAFGLVVTFWGWADKNSSDGRIVGVTEEDVDIFVSQPGFAKAMQDVRWLEYEARTQTLTIPSFSIHNSESAKKRAQASRRQARWRERAPEQPRANGSELSLPAWLNVAQWSAWIKIRPAKARTHDAMAAALAKLEKMRAAGHDANAIVENSLANGWQGLFAPDQKRSGQRPSVAEANRAAAAEFVARGQAQEKIINDK